MFIDLLGASGAAYRFRLAERGIAPTGGNFVLVRDVDGASQVVCCGKARTLVASDIERLWAKDELGASDDRLYLRLNVAAHSRDAEHVDLVSGLPRPFAIYELE